MIYDLTTKTGRRAARRFFNRCVSQARRRYHLDEFWIAVWGNEEEWPCPLHENLRGGILHACTTYDPAYLRASIQFHVNPEVSCDAEALESLAYHEVAHVLIGIAVEPYTKILKDILRPKEWNLVYEPAEMGEESAAERLMRVLLLPRK